MMYTTYGHVRGQCGHQHETFEAAQACLRRDTAGCRSQGGYSDRGVCAIQDGYLYEVDGPHDGAISDDYLVWPSSGQSNGAVRAES